MKAERLRPEQAAIIENYAGGRMGIAAVPGSGKTFTLSHLAARLIADRRVDLARGEELLVVTFTNSAVNSFQARIAHLLEEQYNLLPYVGYRVRTLHGLAHDIVRERPALVGLTDDFVILDETLSAEIQRAIVASKLGEWWDRLCTYVHSDVNERNARYRFEQELPALVAQFIKRAKDMQQTPGYLLGALPGEAAQFTLAQFAIDVFFDYQRSLNYRGAVDFDDLVRLALDAMQRDEQYLSRLRARWPHILEDEAQDSSRLQEEMLTLLSDNRNWVRVGDPNQAINTTFTTADPAFLRRFLDAERNPGVREYPLSVSGRSSSAIVELANELVRWTVEEHPVRELRDSFEYRLDTVRGARRGVILETDADDPQPNPSGGLVVLDYHPDRKISPDQELEMVVSGEDYSLLALFDQFVDVPAEVPRPSVGVLVPRNTRGFKVIEQLQKIQDRMKAAGFSYDELLRSSTETRHAVSQLAALLDYLAQPTDLRKLKLLYWDIMPVPRRDQVKADLDLRELIAKSFAQVERLEDFLWPEVGRDTLEFGGLSEDYRWLPDDIMNFRVLLRRWLDALALPIDQLVLTVAQDLFTEPVDVALAHKVAGVLRSMAEAHPEWRLPQFVEELRVISANQRRFFGFDNEVGYEPKPGVITISTMHSAKGLEWDRVYLLSVNNYDFPSALPYDSYLGEKWTIRGSEDFSVEHLNLEAELLAQLDALVPDAALQYREGEATLRARIDYAKERLRLLYVGITRARRELIITWNMGHFWQQQGRENQPALPLVMLRGVKGQS